MTPKVLLGIPDLALASLVLNRVRHPAIGFDYLDNCVDALELMARIETSEVNILIICSELPNLSKSMLKYLVKNNQVFIIETTDSGPTLKRFAKNMISIQSLAKALGVLRPAATDQVTRGNGELVVVLTVASGSGSSTVAANYSQVQAEQKSVCLADFDLTHPSLSARLTPQGSHSNLTGLVSILPTTTLTPAELSTHCLQLTQSVRLLAGLRSASEMKELDLSLVDEVVDVALELDELVVLDLGQLVGDSDAARIQQELLVRSQLILLISAADPISLLTTCNWLATGGSRYLSKLEIVINKIETHDNKAEIARLIHEAAQISPSAYLPLDHRIHRKAIWAGMPVVLLKPNSKFSKSIKQWLKPTKAPQVNVEVRKGKALDRLREVS